MPELRLVPALNPVRVHAAQEDVVFLLAHHAVGRLRQHPLDLAQPPEIARDFELLEDSVGLCARFPRLRCASQVRQRGTARGATSVGAVTATILKAFFDESRVIANPVQPDPADPTRLMPYGGPPLTVGGELNKLAVNFGFGRNWAGIHWRSDASASMALGEEVAIGMLRDERTTLRGPFDGFSFTRFDGSRVTI